MPKFATMTIMQAYPPMFDQIDAKFHTRGKAVLYCWNDIIYNPLGIPVSTSLLAHEHTHELQQNGDPEKWWRYYIADPEFRLYQEIPAHQAEYREFCNVGTPGRRERRLAAKAIAQRLSSPLYGNLIRYDQALELVKAIPNAGN